MKEYNLAELEEKEDPQLSKIADQIGISKDETKKQSGTTSSSRSWKLRQKITVFFFQKGYWNVSMTDLDS